MGLVRILADPSAQKLISMLESLTQLHQNINSGVGASTKKIKELITIQFKSYYLLGRGNSGGTSLPREYRQLSKEFAGAKGIQDNFLAFCIIQPDLHFS